ncbi:cyclin-A2-1 isoform X2 [Eucalyptus grandis]|uniref:cyclin-A2-1 isoform X2 n=1 Tax=Eucalyptus grandis TaxID=71139 RepID=UPI00192EBAB4|nr:cyclin-A2-1 isoform X2 [Eucalyptus grandis]
MTRTSSVRSANMNKENAVGTKSEAPTIRITRSRSKALGTSTGMLPSSRPSFKQEQKHTVRANAKRSASDENKGTMVGNASKQHKKRTVLNDVTNIFCENSYSNCLNGAKAQVNARHSSQLTPFFIWTSRQGRKWSMKKDRDVHQSGAVQIMQEDVQAQFVEELSKIKVAESMEITIPDKWAKRENSEHSISMKDTVAESSRKPREFICGEKSAALVQPSIVDIDSKLEDPQACTPYALDIYNYKRSTELERRPSTIYMETLQKDVTPNMRGILVDWLVEVSEEYKLVPDTLYLTVNLIDRFLSQKFIEKQRLQLLGVTCMLIASKYEEICPPRVEEFCFITDNTYTSLEVLKMESQVLNLLHFQLSVPTIKTFLRRFVQAAQVSSEVPSVELEYLANYLAELTLVEYSFLKFLPSLMAASAVLLARWTLNQSDNPWNLTLEHYTKYKATELKAAVLALEDLQLNTSGSTLNAIREKYRQQKCKCVATLTPSEPALSLFQRFNYS